MLLKHVQDRIVDEYTELKMTVLKELGTNLRSEVGTEEAVRLLLQDVCDGGVRPGGSMSR